MVPIASARVYPRVQSRMNLAQRHQLRRPAPAAVSAADILQHIRRSFASVFRRIIRVPKLISPGWCRLASGRGIAVEHPPRRVLKPWGTSACQRGTARNSASPMAQARLGRRCLELRPLLPLKIRQGAADAPMRQTNAPQKIVDRLNG